MPLALVAIHPPRVENSTESFMKRLMGNITYRFMAHNNFMEVSEFIVQDLTSDSRLNAGDHIFSIDPENLVHSAHVY